VILPFTLQLLHQRRGEEGCLHLRIIELIGEPLDQAQRLIDGQRHLIHSAGLRRACHCCAIVDSPGVRMIILGISGSHNLPKKDIAEDVPGDAWWTPLR
jgi:hypothetical protein